MAKIKKEDLDGNGIKENKLEKPSIETLLSFILFSYDHDKGLSSIFYPTGDNDKRGYIIIHGDGFNELFNEIDKTGTKIYIFNSITWITQFLRRIMENGDYLIISFNLVNFKYDIKYYATQKRFRNSISNEFNIAYLIDATGSMEGEINVAKKKVINILKKLKK